MPLCRLHCTPPQRGQGCAANWEEAPLAKTLFWCAEGRARRREQSGERQGTIDRRGCTPPATGQEAQEILRLREDKCHRVENHEVGKKKDVSGEVATKQ